MAFNKVNRFVPATKAKSNSRKERSWERVDEDDNGTRTYLNVGVNVTMDNAPTNPAQGLDLDGELSTTKEVFVPLPFTFRMNFDEVTLKKPSENANKNNKKWYAAQSIMLQNFKEIQEMLGENDSVLLSDLLDHPKFGRMIGKLQIQIRNFTPTVEEPQGLEDLAEELGL